MKTLMISLILITMTAKADVIEFEREIMSNSYKTNSPKGEPVQCFPQAQVEKWKKRKVKPKQEPIIVEKIVEKPVEKEKIVEKIVNNSKKNNISLIANRVYTGLDTSKSTSTNMHVETTPQIGVGAMYQRDVSEDIRLSIGATTKGIMAGVGLNF